MEPYIGSNKLATYLHPGPNGPFLEFKSEPLKPPSPKTSALRHHNPSLIDLSAFNCLCERLTHNNSSPNSSPYKPFITPSDLLFCIPPLLPPLNYQINPKLTNVPETTASPISSVDDCSPNVSSNDSTPYSSPKVKHVVQQNSPMDLCLNKDSSVTTNNHHTRIINENGSTTSRKKTSHSSKTSSTNGESNMKQTPLMIPIPAHTSPILHRLLTSPPKNSDTSSVRTTNTTDPLDNENNRSPQYRPRFSPFYTADSKSRTNGGCHSLSKSSRSPVFARRFPDDSSIIDNDHLLSHLDPFFPSMALTSLDTNGISSVDDDHDHKHSTNKSSIPNHKRSLDSSEENLNKRRHPKIAPTVIIQRNYCISYPNNIPRCVDCQIANPNDLSLHLAGCRFQHCRTLKYFGNNIYEIEGFTVSSEATNEDLQSLCTPNSSGQPALNFTDAYYIFTQIAKFFCFMYHQEQNERTSQDENVIWRKYMAGWREVCDECTTTLFNYHYMCKQCGYMICVECSNYFSQLSNEKRKKLKRTCTHDSSYSLSEFIPWEIVLKLRNNVIDYLSRLKLDYSIKLYNSAKSEHLSTFIKSLKMRRTHDARDIKKVWSTSDCNNDPDIEFYCHGRLPVFNRWDTDNTKQFFRQVWSTSCPVLVKQVHCNLSKTLWQPNAFKEHMIDHRETPALWDCETLTPILTNEEILSKFWDGFERLNVRVRDYEHGGRPRILKLKDWPTKKDFASVFPTLLHDLMTNIPFSDYTKRSYVYEGVTYDGGVMNIVERLPSCLVKPDLGPKLYIAYSQLTSQATKKAGTTNLHIDVSDAVNVLVYVGIGGEGDDGSDKEEEMRQVEAEVLDSNIDEAQLQRLRNGERPGALWHLFRSDDAKKIREYIGRTQRRTAGSDSIHDQTAYLEKDDLEKLREWSRVESYPILQFLGDAVFIPSGAPHQVKNLHSCIKIAEDFVSPENLDRCLITTNEFRTLSKTHSNHADILQAKNILYYTTRDAYNSLIELAQSD